MDQTLSWCLAMHHSQSQLRQYHVIIPSPRPPAARPRRPGIRHGKDSAGIEIHTPDPESRYGSPDEDCWTLGKTPASPTNGAAGTRRNPSMRTCATAALRATSIPPRNAARAAMQSAANSPAPDSSRFAIAACATNRMPGGESRSFPMTRLLASRVHFANSSQLFRPVNGSTEFAAPLHSAVPALMPGICFYRFACRRPPDLRLVTPSPDG